jgi:polysaccharide biosynthesis protein PslH
VVSAWEPWQRLHGDGLILHHQLPHLSTQHDIRIVAVEGPAPATTLERELISTYRPPSGVTLRTVKGSSRRLTSGAVRRLRSVRSGEPAHVHWVERPGLRRAMREELDAFQPDVLHLFGWGTAQLHREAPGMPTVYMATDSWELGVTNRIVSRLHRLSDAGQIRLVRAHEGRHYPALGAVVVVAERDAQHLRDRIPGCRVVVLPNGVDAGSEPAPLAWSYDVPPVVAFHGTFSTRANSDAAQVLVHQVLPLLKRTRPDVRVILFGRDAGPEIRALAGPGVDVTGDVVDIRSQLERAAVYVAPLVSGSGIKNKVLEAMAAGLPVVGTPLALEGIGSSAGTISATTAAQIADATARLLSVPGATRDAGKAARQRAVADFSWETNASQLSALWASAVSDVWDVPKEKTS